MTIDAETIEYVDSGNRMDISISILPLKNEDDEINVVMLIARDITKLMDVQRMKDDFISLASHELRTPATVISGYADLLLNPMFGDLSEKQRHYATRAKESTTRLVDLVNDMLDMSRLESGRRPNKPEEIDISAVITEVIQTKQALQQSKSVTVRYNHTKQPVIVDRDRLRQLLEQLLGNAMVFTAVNSEVTIEVTKHANEVQISIRDQGPGIPEEKRQVIFEKFTKLDDTGEISGTGLGLAICKKIVQDWGGTIAVHAQKAGGSVFSFTIPLAKPAQTDQSKQRSRKK
ncbi:MAG: HAMP domain-containing histidine kinase [Chloroflexi bacterium]|nr:MAG: HAMP domain-containing histidine kinase [Chloroflexota bacterium]